MLILVVDDDGPAGAATCAILAGLGHTTVTAETPAEALTLLAGESDIGLIVSELNLPGQSGIALFRQLRAEGVGRPFILLSADDPAASRRQEPLIDACLLKNDTLGRGLTSAVAAILTHSAR